MQIYLPIAEITFSVEAIIFLGIISGVLSSMFGIGGSFIITPVLILFGIPPAVAMSSFNCHLIAPLFSKILTSIGKDEIDFSMGNTILVGGIAGSMIGVTIFKTLQDIGMIDIVINIGYILILSSIGASMGLESARAIYKRRNNMLLSGAQREPLPRFLSCFPLKKSFPKSNIKLSIIPPIMCGIISSVSLSLTGIGSNIIAMPIMIYLFKMPIRLAIGTTVYQGIFSIIAVTFMHATETYSLDIILSMQIMIGAMIGGRIGNAISSKIPPEESRACFAAILILSALYFGSEVLIKPKNIFSIEKI